MNKFLFVFLALVSFQALAINPQDGGAGNVCMTASSRGYYVAVDTVYFSNKDKIYEGENNTRYISPLVLDYTNSDSHLRTTNLTKTKAGRAVLGILGNIADKFDKDFGHELLNIFMTLGYVYMVDYEYKDVYGIKMDVDGFCNPGSMVSVIVTNWAGFSVISRKTWDKLNFQTQKILLLSRTSFALMGERDNFVAIFLSVPTKSLRVKSSKTAKYSHSEIVSKMSSLSLSNLILFELFSTNLLTDSSSALRMSKHFLVVSGERPRCPFKTLERRD